MAATIGPDEQEEPSAAPTYRGESVESSFEFDSAFAAQASPHADAHMLVPLDDGAERPLPIPEAVADTEVGFDTFLEPDRETHVLGYASQKALAEGGPSLVSAVAGIPSVERTKAINKLETLLSRIRQRRTLGAQPND